MIPEPCKYCGLAKDFWWFGMVCFLIGLGLSGIILLLVVLGGGQ